MKRLRGSFLYAMLVDIVRVSALFSQLLRRGFGSMIGVI
jgi:hypothetical protein